MHFAEIVRSATQTKLAKLPSVRSKVHKIKCVIDNSILFD